MTQVGHTLTGLAVGVTCLPGRESARSRLLRLAVFALLANIPDLPFRNWGHDLYYFSHSLFVNLLLILVFLTAFIFMKGIRTRTGGWLVLAGGGVAWLSHLLLDTFYNHGLGLAMLWPFSDARLALPIPWFSVVRDASFPFTAETLRIFLTELAFFGPLLLAVIGMRKLGVFKRFTTHIPPS
jgi:inner membrane protein